MNCIEKTDVKKYIKYAKVNNDSRAIISLEAKNDTEIEGNPIKFIWNLKNHKTIKKKA